MKKRYAFIWIACVVVTYSCSKDPIKSDDTNVGISRITYYANIVLTGNNIMAIEQGTPFTDPGVKATAKGVDIPVTTTGSVDVTTTGVYTLTYSAINADGYPSSSTRTVAVYKTDADAAANDLSGSYLRAATGETSTWTKIAPGVYTVQNPGGAAAGESLVVVVFNPTGLNISIPPQQASDGSESSSANENYVIEAPATYSWVFLNPTYGTGLRTFVKQ